MKRRVGRCELVRSSLMQMSYSMCYIGGQSPQRRHFNNDWCVCQDRWIVEAKKDLLLRLQTLASVDVRRRGAKRRMPPSNTRCYISQENAYTLGMETKEKRHGPLLCIPIHAIRIRNRSVMVNPRPAGNREHTDWMDPALRQSSA